MSTNKRIFLSPPHMAGQERLLVEEAFASNYIAPLGPMVDAFEREFSAYVGLPHCVAVSSGTAAMHLAMRCLDLAPGDTVVASSMTFIGSISPAFFQAATPVFIDCDRAAWNMDPDLLEEALRDLGKKGSAPKVVIPTDLYGQCADYDRILRICAPYGTQVVIDAAEAMGATYRGRHAGVGGKAAVYSFNGNKILTMGGGGMLASEDSSLVDHARKLSQQAREPFPHYEHAEIGYNYRMSNILAAIGRGQLNVLEQRVGKKRWIFDYYAARLSDLPGVSFMPEAPYGRSNRWLSIMLVDPDRSRIDRERIRLALEAGNIESRPVWKPMHLQPVFKGCGMYGGAVSEEFFRNGLCLPSGTAMEDTDLDRVVTTIRKCFLKAQGA
jgi:dTDP-4-amino-4,6-dideoxygalactose transaminase